MAMAKRLLLGFWTVVAGAVLLCALLPATALADVVELTVTFDADTEGAMTTAIDAALAAPGAPDKATVTRINVSGTATDITDGNWEALRTCFTADSEWAALEDLYFTNMPNIASVGFTSSGSTSVPSRLIEVSFSFQDAHPTTIGNYAFQNCSKLYFVWFGNHVETIGKYAFSGCKAFSSSKVPDSVKNIGEYAFKGCTSLDIIRLPDGVTSVPEGAFQGCTGLERMCFPAGVTSIGPHAFDITYSDGRPHSLTQLTFLGAPPTIGQEAFGASSEGILICESGKVSEFEAWKATAFGSSASNWLISRADRDLVVKGGVEGTDWSWSSDNSVLTVKTATPLTISGKWSTTKSNTMDSVKARIEVACGEGTTANITLGDININTDTGSALRVVSGALNLALIPDIGTIFLKSSNGAGIEHGTNPLELKVVDNYHAIEIKSTGGGAGIGGADGDGRKDAGNLILSDDTEIDKAVEVTGAAGCAGIGGATGGSATDMKLGEGKLKFKVTGGAGAAAIGAGSGGTAPGIVIRKGYFEVAGTPAFPVGTEITGGYFGAGDESANTVYGITPQEGFKVCANKASDKDVYPFYVAKSSTLTLKQNVEKFYTGSELATGDVLEAASYGATDAKADVKFTFREAGTQDNWIGGLPKMPGTWDVTATLPAKTVDGVSYAGATATATVTIKALPKPTDLKVADIGTDSAVLSWTAAPNATGYEVSYGQQGGSPSTKQVSGTSFTCEPLEPGTTYEWQVRATFDKGPASDWEKGEPFTTLSLKSPLTSATVTPAKTMAGEGVATTLAVAPNAEVDGSFTLTYQWQESVDGAWADVAGETAASLSVSVNESAPSRTFRCKVTAERSGYESKTVESSEGTIALMGLPANPVASDATTGGAVLSWTAATNAAGYEAHYRAKGAEAWIDAYKGADLTCALASLAPGTTYEWQVRATFGEGLASDWVDGAGFATLSESPLKSATVTPAETVAEAGKTVVLTVAPNAEVDGTFALTYQWQESVNGAWADVAGETGASLSVSVDDRTPARTLRCVVTASKEGFATASVESAPGTVILEGLPSNLAASDITSSGAALTWTAATNAIGYEVSYSVKGSGSWTVAGSTAETSYSLSGLEPATAYEWGVKAKYEGGLMSDLVHGPEFTTKGFVPLTSAVVAPESSSVDAGAAVQLAVTTDLDGEAGVTLAYQWQRLAGGAWENVGGNARAYSAVAPAAGASDTYRCQVTAAKGGLESTTLTSNEAVVSAKEAPKPVVYPVVEGDKGTWKPGGENGMRFRIDALLDKLLEVKVDGNAVVAGRDYDASEGSTVIVLRPAYLAGLAVGEHTLDVTFADGSSKATFTIEGAPGPEPQPKPEPKPLPTGDDAKKLAPTGDPLGLALGGTAALAALAAGVLVLVRKRG
ncbi:fibronectin type III domain-containing protein [Arabiibacter massiliensis]|uniref:fibronectin type III domain-containing protein n=1 Tax=Arabiibacter massiliensis TaxID=1870985 RepID=UPI0009B933DE|nr:fibronectin type III domain-containing protein [Arabiibacter massiliensis]